MKTKVAPRPDERKRINWKKVWDNKLFYLMALPGVVFLILFNYLPMAGIYIAFEKYSFQGGLFGSEFVGLKNFEFFFRNIDTALRATRNTLVINFLTIVMTIVCNVAVAIMLNEIRNRRFRTVSQAFLLFPYFISWIALGAIAQVFFNEDTGLLNQLLTSLGISAVKWYQEPYLWWPILIIVSVWKQLGYGSLVYYAALLNFDQSLYEAAKIDGAGRWKQITSITIPLLKPTIVIMFLLSIGNVLGGGVDMVMGMTQLNPMLLETTDTVATYVYRTAIKSGMFESASAITLYQSIFGFAFVMISNAIIKKIQPEYKLF